MSLATVIVWLVLCVGSVIAMGNYEIYDDYVLLASDVQDFSHAPSVFIIFGENDESLSATTLMFHLVRKFSTKDVLSLTANYTEIIESYNHYYKRIVRPLIVVLLSTEADIVTFQDTIQAYDMSYPQWLIIFMEGMNDFCKRPRGNIFNLKFDTNMIVKCYGDPIVRDWYSIYDSETEIFDLAKWSPAMGLQLLTDKTRYERRTNIGGKLMRIATVAESPFVQSQSQTESIGLFQHIIEELSKSMNFTFEIAYKEISYGIRSSDNNTWSGVIGRIVEGQADIGVAEMTMSEQRMQTVDFTIPLILSRNRLYMQPPRGSSVQWSSYSRAFKFEIWATLGVIFAVSALLITVIRLNVEKQSLPPGHLSENYLAVWGTFCQQGLANFPTSRPLRIAYLSLFMTSLVILAIYSACLISYLTLTLPSLPFNDIEGFVKSGSYQLITYLGSADYNMFLHATDPTIVQMRDMMKDKEHLPKTVMGGFRRVCDEHRVAFHVTAAVKEQLNAWMPCDLVSIDTGRFDSLGMVLTKRSPYRDVMNFHLQRFQNSGIMARMKRKYFINAPSQSNQYHPVYLRGIVPLIVVLLVGMGAGVLVFLGEKCVWTWNRRRSARRIEGSNTMLVYEKYFKERQETF